MKYEPKTTVLKNIPEFIQLKKTKPSYYRPLCSYNNKTIEDFVYDYMNKSLKGREVYDELMKLIAPELLKSESRNPEVKVKDKVKSAKPERYSMEELLSHEERILPFVNNTYPSIGKLMDVVISQAIEITENHSSKTTYTNNGKALRLYFYDHLSYDVICNQLKCTKENVRGNFIGSFISGNKFVEGISLSEEFKKSVRDFTSSLLYQVCDSAFEANDIDTPEKVKFALSLSGYRVLDDIKDWGNMMILTLDSCKDITRKHLISLKKTICDAIVPVTLSTLCEEIKADFIIKNSLEVFNEQIIAQFVKSHPWIVSDDEGRFYIKTPYLTKIHQRQGRIIYEAGGLIHYKEVKRLYRSIYGEDYNMPGIQPTLSRRKQNDFFPYGRTGLWYYSEDGLELKPANKVIAKFVDEKICFYWKDIAGIVSQLCHLNRNFTMRRIRMEITNLCYVDSNDTNHFVKKGEEGSFPDYSWLKGKQNRANWAVNHTFEILNDAPFGKMKWEEFATVFKQDLLETGRPLKVLDDIKYKYSGTAEERCVFIYEKNLISINEDVVQNDYNGDLSMYGLYRKNYKFYNVIFSLAVTELRKREDNKMQLADFITIALKSINSDKDSKDKIDAAFIRKRFNDNSDLPKGLSRFNEQGKVFIQLNTNETIEDTKNDIQYEIAPNPSIDDKNVPQVITSKGNRHSVSYSTVYSWKDVKRALQKDLAFYDRPDWLKGITSDEVLDKFESVLARSNNNNLNYIVPQIIFEFHYARTDRYDLNQYMLILPIAFEALLRDIYESVHRPIRTSGIYELCKEGFQDYANAITSKEKRGFGRILNDLVHKRNLLLHGVNLELSIVTLVQNIVEYIALFVYTVDKYAVDIK